MFTGFATENTPAVQVWNVIANPIGSGTFRIALTDDCAPIQYIKNGGTSNNVSCYLPSSPIEGKVITIVNHQYTGNVTTVNIFSSDTSNGGSSVSLYTLGNNSYVTLFYTKTTITNSSATNQSGWLRIDSPPPVSIGYGSISLGGSNGTPAVSGVGAVGIGGSSNLISADGAVGIGGSSLNSRGTANALIGGVNNTSSASSANTAIIAGNLNTISTGGASGGIFCGQSNTVNGLYGTIIGGASHTVSGSHASVIGGQNSTASGQGAVVVGGSRGSTRSINSETVFPSYQPVDNVIGQAQAALIVLGVETTNATTTTLRSNSSAAGTANQVILPNNSAYYFTGSVIANVTAGGNTKAWSFEGAIKRGANAASTAIVGATIINTIAQDAGASTWTIALAADTTNGGLQVTVTGQAATTIRWVCKVESTEVTY